MSCDAARSCSLPSRRLRPPLLKRRHPATLAAVATLNVGAPEDDVAGVVGAAPLVDGSTAARDPDAGRHNRCVGRAIRRGVVHREPCGTAGSAADTSARIHGDTRRRCTLDPSVERSADDGGTHRSPSTARPDDSRSLFPEEADLSPASRASTSDNPDQAFESRWTMRTRPTVSRAQYALRWLRSSRRRSS